MEDVDNTSTSSATTGDKNFLEQRKNQSSKPSQIQVIALNQYNFERFIVEEGYIL